MSGASVLEKIAITARAVGAIAVMAIGGRFAYVSAKAATAPAPPPVASDSSAPVGRGTDRPPAVTHDRPPIAAKGKIVRVTAMITLPPDQSEIFIDDNRIGKTPYMGNVECELGGRVRVKLVPPKGAPIELERSCDSKDLEITKL
ncbi:MAG: hypothetical protein U0414_18010 [Polyangiaceae bacterium]